MTSKSIIELATKNNPARYTSLGAAQRILIYECAWNLLAAKFVIAQMRAEATTYYAEQTVMWVDAGIDAIHYIIQIMDRAKAQPNWGRDHDR